MNKRYTVKLIQDKLFVWRWVFWFTVSELWLS